MLTSQVTRVETPKDPTWWVLYTRHQHEKTVAESLSVHGFEVFLPLYESTRRWKDRSKILSLPLFPCYVFVQGACNRMLDVVSTPGVNMILHRGERIATIPEAELDAIRRTVEGRLSVEPHPFLKCGERVRVIRGSLEGVEGVLVRKKGSYRLVLSVEMLAQSASVEIDVTDIEPVRLQKSTVVALPEQFAEVGRRVGTYGRRDRLASQSSGVI